MRHSKPGPLPGVCGDEPQEEAPLVVKDQRLGNDTPPLGTSVTCKSVPLALRRRVVQQKSTVAAGTLVLAGGNGRCLQCDHIAVVSRLATSIRQVIHDQMELSPTESDTGCSWFLLSSGCDRSRYYRVAHGTGLIYIPPSSDHVDSPHGIMYVVFYMPHRTSPSDRALTRHT